MSGLLEADLEHLVTMAAFAPSVHNTQPWHFRPAPGGLRLERDRSRQLTVIDPMGRELLLSCGAALHHLEVAARGVGVDSRVTINPVGNTVATVRLSRGRPATNAELAHALAILHRHTYRGRFDDERIPAAALDAIAGAATHEHGLVRIVSDEELVEVEVLVSRAERTLVSSPGYQEELARWVWHGAPDENRGDGIPAAAVDHGPDRAESLEGRQFDGAADPRPEDPPDPEHPTVLLLSSPSDTPFDWIQAGRALSALLLLATELGVVAQPIGQVLDLPASRRELALALGTVGSPQMLLRLGRGQAAPQTPRRAVADVLAL